MFFQTSKRKNKSKGQSTRSGSSFFNASLVRGCAIILAGFLLGQVANWAQQSLSLRLNSANATPAAALSSASFYRDLRDEKSLKQAVWRDHRALQYLDSDQTQMLAGHADFVFSDHPTLIHQYRYNDCVMDLFFVAAISGANRPMQVKRIEIRSRKGGRLSAPASQACVQGIIR